MKVVIVHTDFRIYWPARLKALFLLLKENNIHLDIIEIAGAGSPYAFAEITTDISLPWHVLFPKEKMESLQNNDIKNELYKKLDAINPDVVIAGAIAFPSGALSVSWTKLHDKRIIIFDDAKVEDVKRNGFVNYIKKSIYHGVDAMLYPSPDWESTGHFWGFNSKQLFYGVDVVDNDFWQQEIQQSDYSMIDYFLCIGRQIPKKNFLFVLKAYNHYCRVVSCPFKLLIVGDGPEHQILVDYVNVHGLTENVIFELFKQQKELVEIYRNAKAFVIASKCDETWGLVINEAMASGVPVIASEKCGATHTLVQTDVNGFTFNPFNLDSLIEVMIHFHKLPLKERVKMGKASFHLINKWGIDKFSKSLLAAILTVQKNQPRKLNMVEQFIIRRWRGRYRPI